MISNFSTSVIKQLGCYVYRFVDPRNHETFYIGIGRGNRIFAHLECSLCSYNNENYLRKGEKVDLLEYDRINTIKEAGYKIEPLIERWGLSYNEALIIESVFFDFYKMDKLSNNCFFWQKEHGQTTVDKLESNLYCEEYQDDESNPKYIIIKVKDERLKIEGREKATSTNILLSYDKAQSYKYVLSVSFGVVREVYKVKEWKRDQLSCKCSFVSEPCEKGIRDIFLNKKIPDAYLRKGLANPVLYSKKITKDDLELINCY